MSTAKSTTTRFDRDHDPDLDEPLWPINLAILVIAGAAAAFVGATSTFPDPNLLDFHDLAIIQTGWGRLAAVALTALTAMLAVFSLQRWIARRVIFCLLLGLIIHLWLGLYLHKQYLEVVAKQAARERIALAKADELTIVPDYHLSQISPTDVPLSFEKPVEAEPPRESQPLEVEKKAKEHEVVAEQPAPVPQTLPDEPPTPLRMDRAESSVPLQADQAAGIELSRQSTPDRPEPNEPIPQPETPKTAAAPTPTPAAQTAQAQRRVEQAPTPERVQQKIEDQTPLSASQLARQNEETAPALAFLTPQPASRQARTPGSAITPTVMPELPTLSTEPNQTASALAKTVLDASQASRAASRTESPAAMLPKPAPSTTQPPTPTTVQVPARIGRPRTHAGERPALDSGGAGNPLSRSTRALPTAPTDVPAADQMVSTGIGTGTRPDTDFDASVAGPTRRMTGITTELAIGRTSPDPPAGTMWGEKAYPVPLRRAATSDPSMAPTGSSGGGREQLAESSRASNSASGDPGTDSTDAQSAATAAGPAASMARQDGAGQAAANALAMSSSPALPRRNVGPLSGGAIDVPIRIDSPGTGMSRDAVQRPSASPASSQAQRLQAGPAVPIRQATGPGGLSDTGSPELGIPNRRARPESVVVHSSPGRFMLDRASGRPPLDASLTKPPAAAFKQRFPGERNEVARQHGATESSDRAVEQGLHFLSRCQFPDGRWAIDRLPQGVVDPSVDAGLGQMNADTAATGLALLAFLGKGYTHTDYKYRNQVNAGLRWLIANQQENGSLFNDQSDQTLYAQFYAHGIATIALGEAYGMTWDEELRRPLERAIAFTLQAQHPQRGGWRYRPQQETDTSVSGWHLMALKSAQMAGVEVPTESLARVSAWLDVAKGEDGSRYRYNPYALDTPAQRQGRVPSLAMTAEGLLMRFYLGRDREHPEMISGANYLREHLPGDAGTPDDVYYMYYATQVMFQMQGEYWEAWNTRLRPRLEANQVQEGQLIGSWSPDHPTRDRWGHAGGRLYMTAMHLLMLEVYYRHMPLFREL